MGASDVESEGHRNKEAAGNKWVWRGARNLENVGEGIKDGGEGCKKKEQGKSCPSKAPPHLDHPHGRSGKHK